MTLTQAVLESLQRRPDKIISRDPDSELTADQFLGACRAGAGALSSGPAGRMVGLLLPNSAAYPAALLAVIWGGKVAVPLNPMLKPNELAFLFQDAGIDTVVVAEATVRYRSPAFLGDVLVVGVRVAAMRRTSFVMEYEARERQTGRLVATGSTGTVAFDFERNRIRALTPTTRRALAPMRSRSAASKSARICAASAKASRDAQTKPASAPAISSATPHFVLVMMGSPHAIASSAAFGSGS